MQVYEYWLHTTIGNIFKNYMFVLDLHSCKVDFFCGKKSKFSSENITMLWSQYTNKLNMKVVGWRLIYMIINKKISYFFVLLLQTIKQQWVAGDPMAFNGNLGHRWPKSVQTQLGVKCLFKSSLIALASTPAVQQVQYGFLAVFGPHLVQDLGGVVTQWRLTVIVCNFGSPVTQICSNATGCKMFVQIESNCSRKHPSCWTTRLGSG